MSALVHRVSYSYADYLALEASSNVKHEYFAGQIYGMAGGLPEHAALADTWIETQAVDGDVIELGSVGARLDVRTLYDAIVEPS